MSPLCDLPKNLPSGCPPPGSPAQGWSISPQVEAEEKRNLWILAGHQIVYCVGWIFKTESVIMPAFLDAVAGPGAGLLRGFLPVLNRFGQGASQIFLAPRLRRMVYKKRALAGFSAAMALPLLAMAALWSVSIGQASLLLAGGVLGCYFLFFVLNGFYLLSFGTVQGKLIRPTHRGRLLRRSTFWGTLAATGFALWLLPGWLQSNEHGQPNFHLLFLWVASCLWLSAGVALALREPPDAISKKPPRRTTGNIPDMIRALQADPNLRRIGLVGICLGAGLIVSPHYQALALGKFQCPPIELMHFAITQNIAVGLVSLLVGPMADAWGNRLTLRVLIFGTSAAPALAAGLTLLPTPLSGSLSWLIFIPLGISPLLLPILNNYTLETCPPHRHPRYLSTVNLCVAIPFLLAPAAGWAVEQIGYGPVFGAAAGLLLLAAVLTFRIAEPRRQPVLPPQLPLAEVDGSLVTQILAEQDETAS
ncbi:MAG: MFS transporter [Thermoguttaceae bacterium]|nr:MFS transporter [Thermoguttaceae bacterium]MDW8037851.1 MFS transporter [Thermoguttaceae bacterium]